MFPSSSELHEVALHRHREILKEAAHQRLIREAKRSQPPHPSIRTRLATLLYAAARLLDDREAAWGSRGPAPWPSQRLGTPATR